MQAIRGCSTWNASSGTLCPKLAIGGDRHPCDWKRLSRTLDCMDHEGFHVGCMNGQHPVGCRDQKTCGIFQASMCLNQAGRMSDTAQWLTLGVMLFFATVLAV